MKGQGDLWGAVRVWICFIERAISLTPSFHNPHCSFTSDISKLPSKVCKSIEEVKCATNHQSSSFRSEVNILPNLSDNFSFICLVIKRSYHVHNHE